MVESTLRTTVLPFSLISLMSTFGIHIPLLPLLICSPFLHCSPALIQHVHSQPDIPSLASHPSDRRLLNAISSAHYPSNTLFCQKQVDLFTHHPTDLFHKQPKLKEGGDAEMSAIQSDNHPASLPAKHTASFLQSAVKPICWRQH